MNSPVILDRGYRRYDGPRRPPRAAEWAIFREGVKRVLGLGQKARRKILPWTLLAIAAAAAAGFVGVQFFATRLGAPADVIPNLPSYGELFDFYSWVSVVFIALAAPTLLIPDRVDGVLSVYFSRPLTVGGYLRGKTAAFLGVTSLIYLVPQLMLHLGLASLAPEGFMSYIVEEWQLLWAIPVVTLGYLALHGGLASLVAAHTRRVGAAAAIFFALIVAVGRVFGLLSRTDVPGAGLLSLLHLDQHPRIVRDWLLDVNTGRYPAEAAGFDAWVSAVVIIVVAGLCAFAVYRRYRSEA